MGLGNGTWKWDLEMGLGNGTSVPSNKKELGLKSHFRKAEWWVLRPTSEKAKKKVEQKPNFLIYIYIIKDYSSDEATL